MLRLLELKQFKFRKLLFVSICRGMGLDPEILYLYLLFMQAHFTNGNSHSPLPPKYTLSQKAEQILSEEINNLNPYGENSTLLQGQYPYPVIFEPIRHIKLSRSTYKVTSFIDFTPHIKTFESFEKYLDALSRDMNDTETLGALNYIPGIIQGRI